MKTSVSQLGILAMLVLSMASCKMDDLSSGARSGYFILSELKKDVLANSNGDLRLKSGDLDFSLGTIKASREFYFLITNGGDEPIVDIQLTTGDEAFIISPDRIESLPGRTGTDDLDHPTVIPILTLGVLHGLQLNGVGYTDLLEMGSNSSYIYISGKTLDQGETITIADEFTIGINACVMDIALSCYGSELDLTEWDGAVSSNMGGLGFVRYYKVYEDQVEIKNTGNVDIEVFHGDDDRTIHSNHFTLVPGDTETIGLYDNLIFLKLDSEGTMADDQRIQLGNDGNGYLCVHYYELQENELVPVDTSFMSR